MFRYLIDAKMKKLIIYDATINAINVNDSNALHITFR